MFTRAELRAHFAGAGAATAGVERFAPVDIMQARKRGEGGIWVLVLGLLSVVASLVFLVGGPLRAGVVLVIVLACYLASSGITLALAAVQVRRGVDRLLSS